MTFQGPMNDGSAPLDWFRIRTGVQWAREHCTRDGQRWTRTYLSQRSGIDVATIGRIENVGRYPRYRPDFETIARIVWTLDLTMAQFLARIERPDPPALPTARRRRDSTASDGSPKVF